MSIVLPSARPKRAFSVALAELKPHRLKLVGVLILGLLTAVAGLIGPWAVGIVVDKLLVSPDFGQVVIYAVLIVTGGVVASLRHLVGCGAPGTRAGTCDRFLA